MSDKENDDLDEVELYVKASEDGETLGACPFCQEMFMMVFLKAKGGALNYQLHVIDAKRPPGDFRKFANRLPVLKHGDTVISDNGEIVAFLTSEFPDVDLRFDNPLANANCLEVFSKFSYFIRDVSPQDQLRQELWRINDHYVKTGKRFLTGDTLTNLDLLMIPKLHHIRIASFALKQFVIPSSMTGIWKYLYHVYKTEVFQATCPSDQEIVQYWRNKPDTAELPEEDAAYYSTNAKPRYTWTTPLDGSSDSDE